MAKLVEKKDKLGFTPLQHAYVRVVDDIWGNHHSRVDEHFFDLREYQGWPIKGQFNPAKSDKLFAVAVAKIVKDKKLTKKRILAHLDRWENDGELFKKAAHRLKAAIS